MPDQSLPPESEQIQNVPDKVVSEFITQLSAIEGYTDIAERLHEEIIVKGKTSEAFLRKALFGEVES